MNTVSADLGEVTWRRLTRRLRYLYGDDRGDELAARVAMIVHRHLLSRNRTVDGPLWTERDAVLIAYGDSLQVPGEPPLSTLLSFLVERLTGVVSTIHLLPFYPYSSDDGFSVIDYQMVNPELGTWDDIDAIAGHFDLMFDFVLNHVSRESLWFNDYLEHMPPGKDFFIEVAPSENLANVVRPRSSPLLVEIRTRHHVRHVWATFSHDQIDLNYANPDVLLAMLEILLFYVRQGARILRLDAVAFLWKELGTPCVHLPRTHAVVKLFRDILDDLEPGCVLLTETNVPHAENIRYFGDGDEAHMVYQFALPPLLLHAVHTGNAGYLQGWARSLDEPPQGCTYLNFTASHDGIGLRPLEGIIPQDEVDGLLEAMRARGGFVSTRLNTEGREVPYELNISLFDAVADPEDGSRQVARFLLTQTVALSLRGVPAVYIHSLLATPNDVAGVERTGRIRSINRRKWDVRELERLLAEPGSTHARVLAEYRRRLSLRRAQPAFHPDAPQVVPDTGEGVLCVVRGGDTDPQRLVCLFNFTAGEQRVPVAVLPREGDLPTDLLTGRPVAVDRGLLKLGPYESLWIPW
jgi:sucrose phosphorylase